MPKTMLELLEAAFKSITDTNDLGASVLNPEKFTRFIREARDRTSILNEARFIRMESHTADIDRIGFTGDVLYSGREPDAGNPTWGKDHDTTEADYVMASTATNQLIAREMRGDTSLNDHALRRNIEQGTLENTLVDLLGQAAGRDLEKVATFADTEFSASGQVEQKYADTDGWIKKAANRLIGGGETPDFDPNDPESIFQALLEALPKQYLGDRAEWRIWTPFEVFDAYQDALRERGTQLGDATQTGAPPLTYKGIPVRYAPVLDSNAATLTGTGRVCILSHPDNMAWGVFHEVTIERNRVPQKRRTDWHLTVEADAGYEDENAAVVALLDKAA